MSDLDRYVREFNLTIPDDNGKSMNSVILCGILLDTIRHIKIEKYPIMAIMASKIIEELADSDFAGTMRLVMNTKAQEDSHRYIYDSLGLYEGARVVAISDIDDDGNVCNGATGELLQVNDKGLVDVRWDGYGIIRDIDPHSVEIDGNHVDNTPYYEVDKQGD